MAHESSEDRFKRVVTDYVNLVWDTQGAAKTVPARVWIRPVMIDILAQARTPQESPLDDYHPLVRAAAREIFGSMIFPEQADDHMARRASEGIDPSMPEPPTPVSAESPEYHLSTAMRQFVECQVGRRARVRELRSHLPAHGFRDHSSIWRFMTAPLTTLCRLDQADVRDLRISELEGDVVEEGMVVEPRPVGSDQETIDKTALDLVYRATVRFADGRHVAVQHPWKDRIILMPRRFDYSRLDVGSYVYSRAWEPSVSQPADLLGAGWRNHWTRQDSDEGTTFSPLTHQTPIKIGPVSAFRGTMAGEALDLCEEICADYKITIEQALVLLLSGILIDYNPSAMPVIWPVFDIGGSRLLYHGVAGMSIRAYGRTRRQTINDLFGNIQSAVLRGDNRPFKAHNLELFAYVNEHADSAVETGHPPTWKHLFEGWKAGYTEEQWKTMRHEGAERHRTRRSREKSALSPVFDYRSFRATYFSVLKRLFPVQQVSADGAQEEVDGDTSGTLA